MIKRITCAISLVMLAGLTACGQAAAPTLSAADIQLTGVALAWTGLAMTQTAMPSETPLSPTSTELPTLGVLPTLAPFNLTPGTPGPLSSPTGDLCSQPIPLKLKGTQVQVKFLNKTGGTVTLSFRMSKPNGLGECGTYGFSLGLYDSPIVRVLTGCYSAFAWVTGSKPSTAPSTKPMCVVDTARIYSVVIGKDVIGMKP